MRKVAKLAKSEKNLVLGTVSTRVELALLLGFLFSTPLTAFFVFILGSEHREWWALANSYCFSSAYCLLYLWPLIGPRGDASNAERLDAATRNWIIWLSCFTQISFQIPHNLFTGALSRSRGSLVEWPFYAYALSDSRWAAYDTVWPDGKTVGLPPEVWLINLNDAGFGLLVFCLYLRARSVASQPAAFPRARLLLALAVLWRDATLFRETFEYLVVQHHGAGYPFTTVDPDYRGHAIACLCECTSRLKTRINPSSIR